MEELTWYKRKEGDLLDLPLELLYIYYGLNIYFFKLVLVQEDEFFIENI